MTIIDTSKNTVGKLAEEFSEITVRVRYVETDQMGVVYHANYYVYFELGRVEYMRQRGAVYKEMEEKDDAFIVVAESQCSYLRPARYDDLLRIRTRITEIRKRTVRFAYEVFHAETGKLLAVGETHHVVCNRQGRPVTWPERYRKFFPELEGDRGAPDSGAESSSTAADSEA